MLKNVERVRFDDGIYNVSNGSLTQSQIAPDPFGDMF